MKKKKWYVAMATALLLAAGCSDDLDNGKNNTGAEEDGEKVYMTVNVSTVSQGTLTKADPTPSILIRGEPDGANMVMDL